MCPILRRKSCPFFLLSWNKNIDSQLGGVEHYYELAYVGVLQQLQKLYEVYIKGHQASVFLEDNLKTYPKKMWNEYVRELKRRKIRPAFFLKHKIRPIVNQKLKENGVLSELPDDWWPNDKKTFIRTVKKGMRESYRLKMVEVLKVFESVDKSFGNIPMQMTSFEEFVNDPRIISYWRSKFFDSMVEAKLKLNMSLVDFNRSLYAPFVHGIVRDKLNELTLDEKEISNKIREQRIEAMRAVVVPPLALVFLFLVESFISVKL